MQRGVSVVLFLLGLGLPLVYSQGVYNDSNYPKEAFFLIMACLFLVLAWGNKAERRAFPRALAGVEVLLVGGALLVFALWGLATFFLAYRALPALEGALFLLFKVLFFLSIALALPRLRWKYFFSGVSVGLLFHLILGISQYYGYNLIESIHIQAAPAGTFVNKNHGAHYLGIALPLPFLLFYFSRRKWTQLFYGLLIVLAVAMALYTRTRGLWVSVAVTLVVFLLFVWFNPNLSFRSWMHNKKVVLIVLLVAMGLGLGMIPGKGQGKSVGKSLEDLSKYDKGSVAERLAVYKNSLLMIRDYPVKGVGINNFSLVFPIYANLWESMPNFKPTKLFYETHNDYLQYTIETGVVGGLLFLSVPVFLFIFVFRYLRRHRSSYRLAVMLALLFGLSNLMVHALFEFTWLSPASGSLVWLYLGSLLYLVVRAPNQRGSEGKLAYGLHKGMVKVSGFLSHKAMRALVLLLGVFLVLVRAGEIYAGGALTGKWGTETSTNRVEACKIFERRMARGLDYAPFNIALRRQYYFMAGQCLPNGPRKIELVREFYRWDHFNVAAWLLAGFTYLENDRLAQAKPVIKRILDYAPGFPGGYLLAGFYYERLGRRDLAQPFYNKAVKQNMNNFWIINRMIKQIQKATPP